MRKWMLTANFLADGAVVYARADRTWSATAADALADEQAAIEALVAWARTERLVVDPYPIEVEIADGVVHHLSARERIRAEGPGAVLERFGYTPAVIALRAAG